MRGLLVLLLTALMRAEDAVPAAAPAAAAPAPAAAAAEPAAKRSFNIVCVGDSVTAGIHLPEPATDAPPAHVCGWLQTQQDIGKVNCTNAGLSGVSTPDLLPAADSYFNKIIESADPYKDDHNATMIFSVCLGLCDSATEGMVTGAPVSPKQYRTNMQVIIDELLDRYPDAKVVIHDPTWYSPNAFNQTMFLKAGLGRLQSYFPEIKALVDSYAKRYPGRVFMGDTTAFEYFEANHLKEMVPEPGNAGTFYMHPDKQGSIKLGEFWGRAIHALPLN